MEGSKSMQLNCENQLFKVTVSQEGIKRGNIHVQFRSGEKIFWLAIKEEISERLKTSVLEAKHTSGHSDNSLPSWISVGSSDLWKVT